MRAVRAECPAAHEPRRYRAIRAIVVVSLVIATAACAPTQILTGKVRPSIPASSVVVYSTAPPSFEQVALLTASSKTLFRAGGQATTDRLVRRFCSAAAKLGANGIILDDVSDERSMSVGTGIKSDSYTHNADISLGLGALVGVFKTTGNARAIYVAR